MPLPPQAVDELIDTMYQLMDLLPPNPLVKRSVMIYKKNLRAQFLANAEKVEKNVLEPMHYFLHKYGIKERAKEAATIQEALDEIQREDATPKN